MEYCYYDGIQERASVEFIIRDHLLVIRCMWETDLNYSGDDMNITFKNILLRYDKEGSVYDEPEIRIVEGMTILLCGTEESYGPLSEGATMPIR